jgi:hypothetical protein
MRKSDYFQRKPLHISHRNRVEKYTKGLSKGLIPFYGLFSNPLKIIVITFHRGRVASYAVQH